MDKEFNRFEGEGMMLKRFRFYNKELTPEQEEYIIEEGMENHRKICEVCGEERNKV